MYALSNDKATWKKIIHDIHLTQTNGAKFAMLSTVEKTHFFSPASLLLEIIFFVPVIYSSGGLRCRSGEEGMITQNYQKSGIIVIEKRELATLIGKAMINNSIECVRISAIVKVEVEIHLFDIEENMSIYTRIKNIIRHSSKV